MSADPLVVSPEQILGDVAQTMRDCDAGAAAVALRGELIGILTSSDVLRAFAARVHPGRARVREWMTAEPIAVSASTRIEAAVSVMTEHGVDHVPVVDGSRPVGMLGFRKPPARSRAHAATSCSSVTRSATQAGKIISKAVPRPGSDSTLMWPPLEATIPWIMLRPSPVPLPGALS